MKFKEYKIWRFAYESHEESLFVPEGTEFYCDNKNRNSSSGYTIKGTNTVVWNEHWVAVLPFNKDVFDKLHKHKPLALYIYNLNNHYIILDFPQIFPLSDDWKETNTMPNIADEYLEIRATNIRYTNEEFTRELDRIDNMNLSDDERALELERTFMPVLDYVKIHGFKYGYINATTITTHSWLDGKDVYEIRKDNIEIPKLFEDFHKKIKESNKETFENALMNMVNNDFLCINEEKEAV